MPDRARTPEDVARLVDAERIRQHLSIRAAAKIAGVPSATVQGWLNGRHVPTPALRGNFDRLVSALGLSESVTGWADLGAALTRLRDSRPPYVGLRPFAVTDAARFFGQEAESARVARVILDRHGRGMVAVVGPSGCGKSSLLAAGVAGRECGPDGVLEGRKGHVLTAADVPDSVPTDVDFVVVDQLEDVLGSPERLTATMASLVALARDHVVVLGIRSDAFGLLAAQPALRDALERPVLLAPMTRTGAVEAIEKPAAISGVTVEPGLAALMIKDLAPTASVSEVPAACCRCCRTPCS